MKRLRNIAYSFSSEQVFAIGSSNTPGQLLKMAELFGKNKINIESGYLTISAKTLLKENDYEDYSEIPYE